MHPYLNFNGNAEEAFNFYREVFGGEFTAIQRYKNLPGNYQYPAEEAEKILHMSLKLPNGEMLLESDVPTHRLKAAIGDNFSLVAITESKEESDRIFSQLAKGGTIIMPLGDMFWGAYYGIVRDRFGISWMIEYFKQD